MSLVTVRNRVGFSIFNTVWRLMHYLGLLSTDCETKVAAGSRELVPAVLRMLRSESIRLTVICEEEVTKRLVAVVNNAGINIMVDIELATMEMYKRVAEVNLYGMIRVTKAFCPVIRKNRGRFINVTSVKGRVAGHLDSTYTVTKWAAEAFSDILRREMCRFEVKVVIVEPGDFGGLTGMLSEQTIKRLELELNTGWSKANPEVQGAYGRGYIDSLVLGVQQAGSWCADSLDPVIDAMEDAVTNPKPKYRYLVDGSNKLLDKFCVFARLNSFLPEVVMDWLLPIFFPLPKVAHQTK